MKRIYLIDCPGVVYGSGDDSETKIVLKGVIRIENLENPAEHIPALLERVRPEYIQRTYNVPDWKDSNDFLSKLAKIGGRLLKGGEPDLTTVAKMVLNDWIRGRLPFYTLPDCGDLSGSFVSGKANGDNSIKVKQKMNKIRVVSEFLPVDMKAPSNEDFKDDGNDDETLNNDEKEYGTEKNEDDYEGEDDDENEESYDEEHEEVDNINDDEVDLKGIRSIIKFRRKEATNDNK